MESINVKYTVPDASIISVLNISTSSLRHISNQCIYKSFLSRFPIVMIIVIIIIIIIGILFLR